MHSARYVVQQSIKRIVTLPQQRWLSERATVLPYACIACLFEIARDTRTGFGLPSGHARHPMNSGCP